MRPFSALDPASVKFGSIIYLASSNVDWQQEATTHLVRLIPGDGIIINPNVVMPEELRTEGTNEEKHRFVVRWEHWQNYYLDLALRCGVVAYYFSRDIEPYVALEKQVDDALDLQVKSWDAVSMPVIIGVDPSILERIVHRRRAKDAHQMGLIVGSLEKTMEWVVQKLEQMQKIREFPFSNS